MAPRWVLGTLGWSEASFELASQSLPASSGDDFSHKEARGLRFNFYVCVLLMFSTWHALKQLPCSQYGLAAPPEGRLAKTPVADGRQGSGRCGLPSGLFSGFA